MFEATVLAVFEAELSPSLLDALDEKKCRSLRISGAVGRLELEKAKRLDTNTKGIVTSKDATSSDGPCYY